MENEFQQRVNNAKSIVLSVLSGKVSPEDNPALFEEDSVYLSVQTAELHDPRWLLAAIAQYGGLQGGITVQRVLECMGPLREQVETPPSPSTRRPSQ